MIELRLNYRIDEKKMDVLKYGLSYYPWMKSRRRNCYYLFFSPKATRRKLKGIVCSAIMLVVVSVWWLFGDNLFNFIILGGLLGFASLLTIRFFFKSAQQIVKQVPAGVIAVVDLDKKTFTVRNHSRLPFVQIPALRLSIPLSGIKKVECRSAYKIEINGTRRWDLVGYVPSWSGLYATYSSGDDLPEQTQLWFVGKKIQESMHAFLGGVLKINIADVNDFSRFDR